MKYYAGLETRDHAPTNHRGKRISVRRADHRAGEDEIKYYAWHYGLHVEENHERAARQYAKHVIGGYGLAARVLTAGGFIFTIEQDEVSNG